MPDRWKRRRMVGLSAVALLLASMTAAVTRAAEEWPRWLGPRGDNIVRDAALPDRWPAGGPKKVWEKKVGIGFASPIGFDGKVYVFALEGDDKEVLTAFDAATGNIVWSQGYNRPTPGGERPDPTWDGTRATPAIDAGKVYTYGSTGLLVCRDLADGKELWRVDVLKETGGRLLGAANIWGQASSPLVARDAVYVQAGKGGAVAVAVDKNSGKLLWKSQAEGLGGYAAPILADVPGKPQLIIFGGDALYGMEPQTGKTIWTEPWKTAFDINAATPIYHDGQLFVTSGYAPETGGCALFQLSATGAKKVWEKPGFKGIASKFQPPVLDNGYVYGVTEEKSGSLKCLKWATGETAWQADEPKRLGFGASLVRCGEKLLVMSQEGTLYLMRATPDKHQVLGQAEVFSGSEQVWSSPLVYRGKVYAKGKDQLVCLDLGK